MPLPLADPLVLLSAKVLPDTTLGAAPLLFRYSPKTLLVIRLSLIWYPEADGLVDTPGPLLLLRIVKPWSVTLFAWMLKVPVELEDWTTTLPSPLSGPSVSMAMR